MKPRLSNSVASAALILLLSMSMFMLLAPTAEAHDPPWEIPTYAYIVAAPNPIGVHQQAFVVMWLHAAPPTASGIAGDRWHDFYLDIIAPDGTVETRGPLVSDPTGSTYVLFTPDQVGRYEFVLEYTGQVLTLVNPTNGEAVDPNDFMLSYFGSGAFVNDTFLPSTATTYMDVQAEPVEAVPEYPLPSNYWTHPIEGQNTAWGSIASNWLAGSYLGYITSNDVNLWQQEGDAPDSSHIVWTTPIELGGIVGGSFDIPSVGYYSGGSYEGRFANAIILGGMLYYNEPLGHAASGGGYTCRDLRTGEVVWHSDVLGVAGGETAPSFGQLYDYESMNQHGVVGGILWAVSGTTWKGYDAFTGKSVYNLTDVPSGSSVYSDNGEILRYVFNYNTTTKSGSLALWNNTQEQMGLHGALGTGSSAYQWRPNGKEINMSTAYTWNVTINGDLTGLANPSIVSVIPGDRIIGTSTTFAWLGGILMESPEYITMWAISDNPANRGEILWVEEFAPPAEHLTPYMGPVDPVSRVYTISYVETMEWTGFSIDDGKQIWGPITGVERDFTYYGSGKGGGQIGYTAYGNLYTQGFGGELICYDLATGNVEWNYNNTNSGIESAWGNYPIFVAAIADGKVYAFNNEHSPNYPLYKGEKVYCIDAYTGDELWTMDGWAGQSGGPGTSTSVLADGTFVYYNYYDNQLYAVAKGPSKTTVNAPLTSVAVNDCFTITGTVTDESAGAKEKIADGTFTTVAAMSDASMSSWMEHIYMQKPLPQDATGVTVKLTAYDPNCNEVIIGETTVDANGNYGFTWAPEVPGTYQIVATFEGSDSYYSSYATTYLTSVEAPSASVSPTPTDTSMPTSTPSASASPSPSVAPPGTDDATGTYILLAAAVVVIVAVAGVAALFLRRRQ
ncbi:MAG: hypothetical protein NWF04_06970 [Candidatus Bathyarchaeota archaeon]|nr:hypothetical protein [Candidatus Bathyarchaeota archaeon]